MMYNQNEQPGDFTSVTGAQDYKYLYFNEENLADSIYQTSKRYLPPLSPTGCFWPTNIY